MTVGALVAQSDTPVKRNIIQFTGVVLAPDSNSVIPGVHVYVPTAGRGTTTNPYGFFSLPVLEGDSLVFSAVGFKRQFYIVPEHKESTSLKVLITMQEDVTLLSEVEVFPYPTEAMFKEAILSLETPYQKQYNNLNAWLSSDYMSSAYADLPASPNANHQYYMQMQMQAIQNKYQTPQNNLLNPWAWSKFINSLKKGN
ncbi:carboxypeptidase-like regulatory domain-containing protein [Marinoscillum luteum]|uniref:Carboxypeptidase-like regulatory domain-containing protein n=1 Tax=Marinoscillum luteum TaxID=861051 RepID=A0ABW7N6D3_9BACT